MTALRFYKPQLSFLLKLLEQTDSAAEQGGNHGNMPILSYQLPRKICSSAESDAFPVLFPKSSYQLAGRLQSKPDPFGRRKTPGIPYPSLEPFHSPISVRDIFVQTYGDK